MIQENIDWEYLIETASRHKLIPILYSNLNFFYPDIVPNDILIQLKDKFKNNVHHNLLLTRELLKILDLLNLNGIQVIPYKGPILSILAYDSLALRQFVDLDIYVHKSDALKVKNILISEGYEPFFNTCVKDSIYIKTQSEYKFISDKEFLVEIHLNLQGSFFYLPVKPTFLCNNLKTVNLNNSEVISFNMENLFLILCMHSASHDWDNLSRIYDIYKLICSQKEINWIKIIEKAEKLRIKKILLINLILINDLFGIKLPEEILTQIETDKSLKPISKDIITNYFSDKNELTLIKKAFFDLKKREHIFDGVRDVLLSIFTPTNVDFNLINIPNYLFFLYYLFRPILLFKRFRFNSLNEDKYSHK